MRNIIAKQFNFTLDSKSVKPYKEKGFVCYDTDSIKLIINVDEDGEVKYMMNTKIDVIYSFPNGESNPIRQEFGDGISVTGEGGIEIIPRNNCLIPTDMLRIDINISDNDEFITLQPFTFKVLKSVESEIFDKAETVAKTMRGISEQVDVLTREIAELDRMVSDAEDMITERTLQAIGMVQDMLSGVTVVVDEKIEEADAKLDVFANRIDNSLVELDECFLRTIPLTPKVDEDKIMFETDLSEGSPIDLVGKSYIMTVTGSVANVNTITSHISILYFTQENDKVVINYVVLASKSVQGKSISVTPQFNNSLNYVPKDSTEFGICIKTNILANYIDNALCTIASNSILGNKL